mmetsp:Transcript_95778/g.248015  ORF Transcript_95778/g.248015 Transcript_95778/m.248015 type:complete len:217 (+) Transcript_95778:580-1230(+)
MRASGAIHEVSERKATAELSEWNAGTAASDGLRRLNDDTKEDFLVFDREAWRKPDPSRIWSANSRSNPLTLLSLLLLLSDWLKDLCFTPRSDSCVLAARFVQLREVTGRWALAAAVLPSWPQANELPRPKASTVCKSEVNDTMLSARVSCLPATPLSNAGVNFSMWSATVRACVCCMSAISFASTFVMQASMEVLTSRTTFSVTREIKSCCCRWRS